MSDASTFVALSAPIPQAMQCVNGTRLIANLQHLTQFGGSGDVRTGVCRQALTDEELYAKQWLCSLFPSPSYRWSQDAIGNLFLRREGQDSGLAPVLIGSHIDTQPTGGWLDGAYGVMAGYEVCMALDDAQVQTRHPIEIAAWTNEEGSRFAPGAMGSSAFVKPELLEHYLSIQDTDGISIRTERDKVLSVLSQVAQTPLGHALHAYLEAHIEQGPVMEDDGTTLGIVESIQGVRWYRVRVEGRSAHAGTTPQAVRKDALLVAAQLIAGLHEAVHVGEDERLRWTVAQIQAKPSSINTIAQDVEFTIDLRHPDIQVLDRVQARLEQMLRTVDGKPCKTSFTLLMARTPTLFHHDAIAAIRTGVQATGEPFCSMTSGAFHDAMHLADACPSAMLFVPSIGGISHHPDENTRHEHLIAGARALTAAALQLAL